MIHLDGRLSKAPPPEVRLLRRSIDLRTLRRRSTRHSQTDSDIACLPSARASDGACVVSAGPASIDVAEVAGGMSGGGGREFLGGVHHEAAPLGDGLVERLAFKDHELGALLAVQGQR